MENQEETTEKKGKWGGPRPNSGRPKKSSGSIALRVPQSVLDVLSTIEGSKTDYIVAAILEKAERDGRLKKEE